MMPQVEQMRAEAEMQRAMAHKQRAIAEVNAKKAIEAVDAVLTQQSEQTVTVNGILRGELLRQLVEYYEDSLNDDDR